MKDLRKEVGMQCSLTGRLVKSKMRRAGHLHTYISLIRRQVPRFARSLMKQIPSPENNDGDAGYDAKYKKTQSCALCLASVQQTGNKALTRLVHVRQNTLK
ncbi:hypothetical protein LSAT2_009659 [Lamellibrachia satsuma]|nr:hypothetical protein LSAT2_009659 [Lamellibrachia satsuma]